MRLSGFVPVTVLLLVGVVCGSQVHVELQPKWKYTSTVQEASEFFAKESNAHFWKFTEALGSLPDAESAQYHRVLEVGQSLLSDLKYDLLNFALNIHQYSPRVELHRQQLETAAKLVGTRTCDGGAMAHVGSQFVCSPKEVEAALAVPSGDALPEVYSFDHVYPGAAKDGIPDVVLYASIGSSSFLEFHGLLSAMAREGKLRYVLRHFDTEDDSRRINLQGFGVELAIKNMEYKTVDDSKVEQDASAAAEIADDEDVQGILFKTLLERRPSREADLLDFRTQLLSDAAEELEQVRAWQMKDLGFLAVQRILAAQDPLKQMRDLAQNFPTMAAPLSRRAVNQSLVSLVEKGMQYFNPGDNYLFVNGRMVDPDTFDPYSILLTLHSEAEVVERMADLNFPAASVDDVARVPLQSASSGVLVDIRVPQLTWINDLSKDQMYQRWPRSVQELLKPTYPGQLKFVASNVFNAVFVINPVDPASLAVVQSIQMFHQRMAPVRFGVVLVTDDWAEEEVSELTAGEVQATRSVGSHMAKAFRHIAKHKGGLAALDFLAKVNSKRGRGPVTAAVVREVYAKASGGVLDDLLTAEVDKEFFHEQVAALHRGVPARSMVVNGHLYQGAKVENYLVSALHQCTQEVASLVMAGDVTDATDTHAVLLSRPFVLQSYDAAVVPSDPSAIHIVSLTGAAGSYEPPATPSLAAFDALPAPARNGVVLDRLTYASCGFGEPARAAVSLLLAVDLATHAGRDQVLAALDFLDHADCASVRVAFMHNPEDDPLVEDAVEARGALAVVAAHGIGPELRTYIHAIAAGASVESALGDAAKAVFAASTSAATQRVAEERALATGTIGVRAGATAVVANGRVVEVAADRVLATSSLSLLTSYERTERGDAMLEAVAAVEWAGVPASDVTEDFVNDRVMKTVSLLAADDRRTVQRIILPPDMLKEEMASVEQEADAAKPSFTVFAIVDPISVTAQRLAPLLMALRDSFNVNLKVLLNPPHDVGKLPITKFYRYAMDTSVEFDPVTHRRVEAAAASFDGLPTKHVYTMGTDVPAAWMVEPVVARHDLDNIKLDSLDQGDSVRARYQLTHLLVEGNCYDSDHQPPSGLQLILGTSANPHEQDTIVMANLGYYQLKARPGVWKLRLKDGRSSDLFSLLEAGNAVDELPVVLDTFSGAIVPTKVEKKAGKEHEELLTSSVSKGRPGPKGTDETIHIFSVASGRLYERFLKIMMVTVSKATKNPVKFWFIKNFLSPAFKDFVPHMAAEYGFEVELVEYKWPRWLHAQTEKQRQIWGYKILFLDVLFPLAVEKVIFVDADQIVRADMLDLVNTDLKGAPYGFTPFCSSRKETDGFRFWASGYWKNHLGKLPYHISALFVVDLVRFREMSAGDTLRATYDALSKDPNSLANLDQDLPNQLQHQVPIHSLPQEWLWCETWCSDETKPTAKTIDLCNNPLTKTPKLENAKRIVPEWVELDEEVKALERRVAESASTTHASEDDVARANARLLDGQQDIL